MKVPSIAATQILRDAAAELDEMEARLAALAATGVGLADFDAAAEAERAAWFCRALARLDAAAVGGSA